MCPDKHYISIDMCWGPSAARVKISGKKRPFVERQAQETTARSSFGPKMPCLHPWAFRGRQGVGLAWISPLLIYFQSLEVRGGVWVIQTLQSSSTSVLQSSEVDNLNFSQLAVWEPIRHCLKRNSLCAALVSGNSKSLFGNVQNLVRVNKENCAQQLCSQLDKRACSLLCRPWMHCRCLLWM